MKPTVMANAASSASAGGGPGNAPHSAGATSTNGITIPINHQYGAQQPQQPQQQQYPQQQQQPQQQYVDPSAAGYGSPSGNRQFPAHFQQGFGFEPDMDDMFSRSRLGRMHDPFASFTTRKRCGNEPHATAADGFSHYFDDDPDFGFPQFGTLGRRRAAAAAAAAAGAPIDPHANIGHDEHDFFNRLPSEFRQYIPEGFGHTRRSAPAHPPNMTPAQSQAYYAQPQQQQHFVQPSQTPPANPGPQSPSKKLCDAAIQTEDPLPSGPESVHAQTTDQLHQHGLRNTVDMGVKSVPEGEDHGMRAQSAPPNEQLQQQQQMNGKRPTPPPTGQYATQTSPQVGQQPPFQKIYYPPQQQAHPQQKQQTPPPPQTPGGTYIRTIPIFVEGRSEPIINSHKEIPNQNAGTTGATATATARANVPHPQQQQHYQSQPQYPQQQHTQQQHPQQQHPQHQQQHRPTPLNTHQEEATGAPVNAASGVPPQTPHTLDSINKIQDIQRDVLDLMSKVENFAGRRQDKEYAYLDEMLTRNLLKLDTIDTNGKDSIRLARKEAIKCIQASINVLEAKAEENARMAALAVAEQEQEQPSEDDNELRAWSGQMDVTKEAEMQVDDSNDNISEDAQPVDATKIQEPIPLPAPEGMQMSNEEMPPEANTERPTNSASPAETQESTMSESKTE